jgi:CDP-diacylglycerol--glycerol-3-phosphate 3-phosphatidyltransferase
MMQDSKLLNKHVVNGFLMVIEPIARLLINLKVHPHVITFAGLFLSILAFNFFRLGLFFYAGLVVILAGMCDVLDGRLARDTKTITKFGALMDSTIDRYSEVLMFLGIAMFFHDRQSYIVYLIIFAITGSFMVSYTRARAEGLGIDCKIGLMQRPERVTYLAIGSLLGSIPKTRYIFLILTIWFIAVFANVTVVQRIIFIRSKLKDLSG